METVPRSQPGQHAAPRSIPPLTKPPTPSVIQPNDLLALIGMVGLSVAGWPLLLALRSPNPFQPSVVVAHVSGMLAGYGVVVLIGLMSRMPALERGIGADRLARWHAAGGRLVVTLVVVHAWAAVTAWADSRQQSALAALWQVLRLPGLIGATIGTALLLAVAVISIRAARRRVRYETWQTVHLLVYVAVALSFVHQLAGPDLAGYRAIQVAWALLYTLVFGQVLQHRLLTPLRAAGRHRMRVVKVVDEAPDVVSLVVEGRHLDELDAQPGQFFRWRFLTPDTWRSAHPFSLSAPPTDNVLRLTVKSLGDGSHVLQHVDPGTWIVAEGPYGTMTAERRTRRDVLLIAGGVGITPLRALFETIELAPGQDLLLLYRVRTQADIVFHDEWIELTRRPGARVEFLLGDVGPLSPQRLTHFAPNLRERDVYLCGPPGMAKAVRRSLLRAGLPPSQLHEERFGF